MNVFVAVLSRLTGWYVIVCKQTTAICHPESVNSLALICYQITNNKMTAVEKRAANWLPKEHGVLMEAVEKRQRQINGKYSGPGDQGPNRVTKYSKSKAWEEVAAEVSRFVNQSLNESESHSK